MASGTALPGHHIMTTKRVVEMTKHSAGAETREGRVARAGTGTGDGDGGC